LVFLLVQAKQSLEALLAGALRGRLRCRCFAGPTGEAQEDGGQGSDRVIAEEVSE
jgi:hypothetical protein